MKCFYSSLFAVLLLTACSGPVPFPESSEKNPLQPEFSGKQCLQFLDASEVTHLKAETDDLAYACMGWVHAKNRAFQMDYLRRAASGRLAELFGTKSLKGDFFLRLVGLREKAIEIFAAYPQRDRRQLWAYAHGVNQAFATAEVKAAYEFKKWSYQPESWHPVDSLAILLLESFNETQGAFWQGLREEKIRERFGNKAKPLFQPYGLPWDAPILKAGETYGDTIRRTLREPGFDTKEGAAPWAPKIKTEESGSNSWVVGKSRSQSGKAWFANDPHLTLSHPPFWFWVHLSSPDLEVVGASVPGVPIIASGFNRKVAWGLTDSYIAVGEVLAVPTEDTTSFTTIYPKVFTRVGPWQFPITFKKFMKSPDGWPVLPLASPKGKVLVLRWSGLNVTALGLGALSQLPKTQSVGETAQWFAGVELPSWNYVFADSQGAIGYRAIGLLPKWDGELPFGVAESRASRLGEWEFLAPAQSPQLLNPKRDFIVTANNRQELTPHPLDRGRAHRLSFRAFRIEELIKAQPKHNLQSMARIQCDFQTGDARFVVPKLMAFIDKLDRRKYGWGVRENHAIDEIKRWDFDAGPDCKACAVFYRWTERIGDRTGLDFVSFFRILDSPDEYAFAIAKSLSEALDDLRVVDYRPLPTWGQVHRAYFGHISGSAAFEKFDYLKTGGFDHTINMASAEWVGDHYSQRAGSSHRLLVEMTSPPTGYFAMPGPASDTEAKDIRNDQAPWRQWQDCHYRKIEFPLDWKNVSAAPVTL